MQVLVTGAGGLLGSNVAAVAAESDVSVLATYHNSEPEVEADCEQLDITDTERFETLVESYDPDLVINGAAMTDVDGCEDAPEKAREVNGKAPGRMARISGERDIGFMQVSTDYVFDGKTDSLYEPDGDTNPIQVYGQSKLLGEQKVKQTHPEALITRLSFVYGRNDCEDIEGFPAWVLNRLEEGEPTPLFTDQHITPTRAESAAETILELHRHDVTGTVHVAARDCVTPYEYGTTLAELAGKPTSLLKEGQMADIDRAAARPRNTCLSVYRTESTLGRPQPTLEEDLRALL
jgi:dTDP-4-dehydrorhamnose reductase